MYTRGLVCRIDEWVEVNVRKFGLRKDLSIIEIYLLYNAVNATFGHHQQIFSINICVTGFCVNRKSCTCKTSFVKNLQPEIVHFDFNKIRTFYT